MQFKDVIGQTQTTKHLTEMVHENRLSHALLFLGKEGCGALPLALAFTQFIVCEKVNIKKSTGISLFGEEESTINHPQIFDSCGVCASCIKANQYIHPDIHFSYPVVPAKAGDKPIATDFITDWREFINHSSYGNAFDWIEKIKVKENQQGNITAEECNDIIHKLSLKSFESGYKILVMWMPEYLGKEGNKLLKSIEEPPPNTLFILVAESEEQILPTILSRCQLVKIPALEDKDIEEALIMRNNTSREMAHQTAAIAEGNYREALQLLQHASEDWQSLLRDWLNAAIKGGPIEQVKCVEEMSKLGREKQKQFLRYFNHLLMQSIRIRIIGADRIELDEKEKDFANRLNKIAGIAQQEAIVEELDKATYYIERNANAKMLLHALTIKLAHIIQHKTLILMD